MRLRSPNADAHVPDGTPLDAALARTTHLGVGAHPDDLEAMAFAPVATCYADPNKWFCAVVCTDGRGAPRGGPFAGHSDAELAEVRAREQRTAADLGRYGAVVQLRLRSAEVCTMSGSGRPGANFDDLVADLVTVLRLARPEAVYAHDLADRHPTHVAVAAATVEALRQAGEEYHPDTFVGCEGWRSLAWLPEAERIALDSSGHDELGAELIRAFESQVAGGKRYDLALPGRRRANATLAEWQQADTAEQMTYAMDLRPLLDLDVDPVRYLVERLKRLTAEISDNILPYFPQQR